MASSLPANRNLPSVLRQPLIRWLKFRDPMYRIVIVSLFTKIGDRSLITFLFLLHHLSYLNMSTIRCTPSRQKRITNLLSFGQHWISLIAKFVISFIFIFLLGCQESDSSSCFNAIRLPLEQPENNKSSFLCAESAKVCLLAFRS